MPGKIIHAGMQPGDTVGGRVCMFTLSPPRAKDEQWLTDRLYTGGWGGADVGRRKSKASRFAQLFRAKQYRPSHKISR